MRSYGKMVFLGGLLTREEVDGYYDKCMELARGRGDREEIYNTSARYYRDRGDYERSTAYMDSLLTHYAETGKKADLGSIYIAQSHLYEKAGDYAKALEAMRKGNDFRYHSRRDQAQSKLAEMQGSTTSTASNSKSPGWPTATNSSCLSPAASCCCCSPAGPPTSRRWSGG